MWSLLLSPLRRLWPYIAAMGAALAAFGVVYLRGRSDAKAKADLAAARRDAAAHEERLEMHREATEIERKVSGHTDDEARKEAMKWAKR